MNIGRWLTPHEQVQSRELELYRERSVIRRRKGLAVVVILGLLLEEALLCAFYARHWALFTACAMTVAMVFGIIFFFLRDSRGTEEKDDDYRWVIPLLVALTSLYFTWNTFEDAWLTREPFFDDIESGTLRNQVIDHMKAKLNDIEIGVTAFKQGFYAVLPSVFLAFLLSHLNPPADNSKFRDRARTRRRNMRSRWQAGCSARQ